MYINIKMQKDEQNFTQNFENSIFYQKSLKIPSVMKIVKKGNNYALS